jgi:hypothetical protein
MPKMLGYNGNPKLRRAHTMVSMSQHQVEEFRLCARDPIYFIKKYVKIVALGKGIVSFDMYPFQEDMVKKFINNRFVICKIPRQSGKSVTTIAFLLHSILFNENYNIAVLAHKGSAANGLLGRLKLAFENLPTWMQSGIVEWNKSSIELENGSKIAAFATSADGLRSGSYDMIFLDEVAFVQSNIAEEFFTSTYPVITAGTETKIIIVSTPKGMNHFYTMWTKAVKGMSSYIPIEVHYSEVPGRDEKWREETIRNTSAEQFQQEFETEFIGSSSTLISGPKIAQMMANIEDPIANEENLDIFEKPDSNKTYVISVDVSEGQELDYSAFSVIDVSKIPYTLVAKYRNNKIKPLLYPTVIYTTAKKYNDAFVLIEINSIGAQVADILHNELQYENLLKIRPSKGKVGQQLTAGYTKQMQFGLKQSVQTKKIGCANLKTLIESDKLIIKDIETVSEFTTFTVNKQSFKAEDGKTDDLVMSLVNFGWLSAQRHFKENVGNDIRKILQAEQFDIMDQDLVPFGIIDDGLNNTMENIDGDLWMEDRQRRYPFDDLNIDWRHKL